jgi:lysylphosphatidylglycerol synthetase-like protein (DUF2156 family)
MIAPQKTKWPSVLYTVWDEAWLALSQPRQYIKWAYQPFRRSLAYLSILLAIMSIASTIYYFLNVRPQIKEGQAWLAENLPQVVFTDGRMTIAGDETFLLSDNEQVFFKVDPTESLDGVEVDPFYEVAVLVLNDGLYTRKGEDINTLPYQELGIVNATFNGQDVARGIEGVLNVLKILTPFLIFAYLLVTKLILTFLVSLLFYLFGGMRATLKGIWSMSLYAMTPALLAGYLSFLFLPVQGVGTVVFLVYLTMAMVNFHRFLDFQSNYRDSAK